MEVLFLAIFSLVIGLVLCFWGYRAFMVMLPVFGFFAGFWLGAEGVALILGGGFLATVSGWVVGFIVGLFIAVLSYLFYFIGVAFVAAGFGAALGAGFMEALGFGDGFLALIVVTVLVLVMVGLTLVFNLQKYVIMAMTAIGGANAVLLAPLLLFGQVSMTSLRLSGSAIRPILAHSWFWLVVWLAIAIASLVYQIRNNKDYTFDRDIYVEGWG
jgi:hypothetical protein